ncbi:hypothetical protein Scep_006848 [Stephania cephalantha]|uniref:Uncharacterized protein n=1 Tax=Stephania cephalantha TaxID=152367 RepID=A0AAP0PPF9_9MAGN
MGGVEDDMHDEEEEEEDEKNEAIWGRNKNQIIKADNVDYEIQSSDEDLPAEEDGEALRLQKKKAQSLLEADFEQDESDSDSDKQQKLVRKKEDFCLGIRGGCDAMKPKKPPLKASQAVAWALFRYLDLGNGLGWVTRPRSGEGRLS